MRVIEGWVERGRGRTISIHTANGDAITVTGASKAEQRELIDAWLARQRASQTT